jgi:hypothetical protein
MERYRALLEKLIIIHLLKNLHVFVEPKIPCHVHKSLSLDRTSASLIQSMHSHAVAT